MNIASAIKKEVERLARKVVRTETQALQRSSSSYRSEIAALKRRVQSLEQALKRHGVVEKRMEDPADEVQSRISFRFSSKGLAAQRQRLGLSVSECALLLGATGQSVYNWEAGTARPRAKHLQAISLLRTMGKKAAVARLNELKPDAAR